MANLKNKLNQLADKTKQAAEQKAKTTTATTTKKSSGAGAAVSNITQAAQAAVQNKQQGSQGVTQASINRMEKAAQQNPNQTIADRQKAIRSGQKVTASPTQTAKPTITAGRESTTPLAKAAGSSNIKNKLVQTQIKTDQRRKANLSRLGKDSTIGRDFGYTRDRDLTAVTITPAQQLNSLATRINDNEQQLINWGRRLSVLKAKANRGDEGAVASYNLLADKYNAAFEDYVSDIGAYNKLYNGAYRDSSVRGKYAQREYMQQRQANRDLGARRSYQQRLNEEEARAPQETTLRRKGASVGEHSYKRITGEEPREAGYTFTYEPTRLQQWGRAIHNSYVGNMKAAAGAFYRNSIPEGGSVSGMNSEIGVSDQSKARLQYWSNELLSSGREQSNLGTYQTKLASQGLGTFGTFIVDASIAGVQMLMDMGISVVTGGSMLPAMFVRSMGGGYLTAEQMGASDEEALAYGIGVGAVEALSEKMFSVFSIGNRFAKGAVNKEMSERIIDRLVKHMATTPEGKTALSRLFTLLFATGSEGLEEVAAGIMEPVIRKFTMDPELDISSEIDWQEALYEGLIGGLLGGIGGAVDLPNTKGTYWKYYKEGLTEGIDRYVATAKKYGIGSEEALQAAKEIWTAGNEKLNGVAGFIVGANADGTGGEWVPLIEATQETIDNGLPVTFHQVVAQDALNNYEYGVKDYGIVTSQDLNLRNYLNREENARKEAENQRLEAARREEAARLEAEEKARVATEKPAQTATEGETVRLDTARSAQNRTDVNNVTPAPAIGQPAATPTTQGIPAEEMTQEEKDELQYGSGAVEDLGKYSGLAQRLGAPDRSGDVTRRVNELGNRLQGAGLLSVEQMEMADGVDGAVTGGRIFINSRLSDEAAKAATMGHEVVHFARSADPELIRDVISLMRRQGRDVDALAEEKEALYRKQFGAAFDEQKMDRAYFEEEVAADFIGEICRADSATLDKIAAEEPGLIRRIINALRNMLARITGNQQAVYEQAIDRLNAALEKAGRNENAVRTDDGVRYKISQIVDEVINNNGKLQAKYNQEQLFDVPSLIADAVSASSGGLIDIHQKKVAIEGTALYHEYIRHSDAAVETARDQIPMTRRDMVDAIAAILHPDYIESIFTDRNNPTQRQSFAYAKKDSGYYIVVEAVGGNRNPNIVPVMILRITENKWNDYIGAGKSLAEMLFENNADMLNAVPDNEKNKKNRVTVAQFAPPIQGEPLQGTPRSPRFTNSIAQPAGKNNTPGQQSSGTTEEGAALLTAMKQMSDQMTKLTEMLSERTGEAPAVAAENDQDADYQTAVESGDMETARRMVDEAAKAAGYDMHLYHGAKKGGGFTVFRDWQYFTENKKYAERYQQRDNDDSLYEVYAKSGRMFDTRKADDKAVYDQYSREYGMGELQESGLPDWTDGYDLSEMIEENDLDYDGIIVDEGGDLVNGEPIERGPSYILRKSEQVKSAAPVTRDDNGDVIPLDKRFDLSNPDIRFSLSDSEQTLEQQLRKAQRQAAYWEKQAKRTEHPMLREQDVEKLTKDLLKGYESKADRAEMTGRIKELGEYILNGGPDLVWDEVQERAGQIAGDILDQSERVDDHMWRETAGLRQYLRTTRIKLDPDLKESKGFFPEGYNNFRKRYYGRLLLANDGQSVDSVYTEAAGLWPGLLPDPEEVYSEGEALNNLVALLDSAPPRRYNPYEEGENGTDMEAARELLTNDIIDGLLSENVRQVPPTMADRMAAEAARREAAPAIREEARRERTDEAVDQLEAESGEARHSVPTTAAELEAAAAKAKQVQKQTQKILRSLRLTPKETALANDILDGTLTVNEMRRSTYDQPVDKRKVERAYEAKRAAREAQAPVDEYNKQRRADLDSNVEALTENSDEWKDHKNMFAYARETARRNFYGLTKDAAEAEAMIGYFIDPIREHEAAKNRMVSRYNDRIKKLGIETRKRKGNKVSEAYAIQFIGELEFIRDWLESLPEGETRDGVTYQEAMTLLDEFWRENPNFDKDRIYAAVAEFRGIYDELFAMVNEARVLNGYAPIDYRKGYFPHFSSNNADNIIQALANGMGIGVEVTELPTSIAGTTHLFRPGIQWSGHMQRRVGNETDYNVLEGWDRYIPAVANIIYHTEDIQKLRALERVLRQKYNPKTVSDEIDSTHRSTEMTAEEKYEALDKLFNRDTTQLNYFVQWVREYTNQLAGKRAETDRNVEKNIGRSIYSSIQKIENRVAANMLGGNISSAMTNFVPLFQAWGNVSTASMMRAMWDTGLAAIRRDGFRDGSDFLVNRRGYDAMYQTLFGKTKNALFLPFNIIDDFVSETIVRARYYDELRSGLSPEAALMAADTFAGSVMADRAVGELPTIFNSKNPIYKVFTMFQVEVNNDLSHLIKDIPRDAKKHGMAALFMSLLKYMLGVYMFNDLFEWLFGRRVSLDPLSMLNDLVGDATGYELPNMFESAALIAKGEWQGWEEFENGKGGNFLSDLIKDAKNWADDLPFISGILNGGRYPIRNILPEKGSWDPAWEALQDILKGEDRENTEEYDLSKMYKFIKNPLWYWASPAFGGQARKIAEGIQAYTQHGSYSQTKQGKVLQYPILGYDDLVKSMIFGKTTTRYGKEWIESDFDSLTAPQTEAYINLVSGGSDPELIYQILHDLKGTERTAVEKAHALAAAALTDGERIALFSALDRDKEAENFADLMLSGLTFRQCADVLDEYRRLKDLEDQTAKGDEGTAERRRLSTEFSIFLADQGFDDKTVSAVQEVYDMQVKPIRYDWLTAAGIHREGAMELALDWSELEPRGNSSKVTDNQKIMTVADAGYLSENERHMAIRTLLTDDEVVKYNQYIVGYQIPVETYGNYIELSYDLKADDLDGDGKGDAYSLAKKKFAVIDRLPLQPGQKTALAIYASGNKESTVRKYAPWLQ